MSNISKESYTKKRIETYLKAVLFGEKDLSFGVIASKCNCSILLVIEVSKSLIRSLKENISKCEKLIGEINF